MKISNPLSCSPESWVVVLARLFTGLVWLTATVGKFKGQDGSYAWGNYIAKAEGITKSFAANTPLPEFMLIP